MMKDVPLISEMFPKGVVFRLSHKDGQFLVRWLHCHQPQQVEAPTLGMAVEEAINTAKALQSHGWM